MHFNLRSLLQSCLPDITLPTKVLSLNYCHIQRAAVFLCCRCPPLWRATCVRIWAHWQRHGKIMAAEIFGRWLLLRSLVFKYTHFISEGQRRSVVTGLVVFVKISCLHVKPVELGKMVHVVDCYIPPHNWDTMKTPRRYWRAYNIARVAKSLVQWCTFWYCQRRACV